MIDPTLDINIIDTHSLKSIAILDISSYPTGWVSTTPTIEIIPPNFTPLVLDFTPNSLQIYKSTTLGIACMGCDEVNLPDGIWNFKYSLYPANKYYVERTFTRVSVLQSMLDKAFISLELTECDEAFKKGSLKAITEIEMFLEMAIAAGNKCINNRFITYYNRASDLLDNFINRKLCKI